MRREPERNRELSESTTANAGEAAVVIVEMIDDGVLLAGCGVEAGII
jgi:hypothetical protein